MEKQTVMLLQWIIFSKFEVLNTVT